MEKTNKKTTAVEWLVKQLTKQREILKNHFEEGKWNDDRCSEIDNCLLLCEQAKAMEREQIVEAFNEAVEEGSTWHIDGEGYFVNRYGGNNG
jgi:oligoribonuclease NrnB/cAMP/cGMP phosphodiesterase (DHH superfamily)